MPTTFLSQYLEHTSIYESCSAFWKWSGYAAISAVLRDNCFRRQGDSALYPNIYVILLATSGVHRKGRPVELCENLVIKAANTKVIGGRASIQAILDEISHAETDKKSGKIIKAGSATFFAPELAAGIVDDPAAVAILTDIYDYKSNPYRSRLRTGPSFNIDKLIFSMLAATNEDLGRDLLTTKAIKGGLLARTFLITPNEFRPSNSLMRHVDRSESLKKTQDLLFNISKLNGEFSFEEDAITEYEEWYAPFRMSYKDKHDSAGVVGRMHTGVLKLAMILAANEGELWVRKCHIEEGINECLSLIPNYNQFVMNNGNSNIREAGAILINDLLAARENLLTRKELLRRHWQDFDAETLDKLVVTMEQAGMLVQIQSGNSFSYKLTKLCLETMGVQ